MIRPLVPVLIVAGFLAALPAQAQQARPLYQRTIATYPSPVLQDVGGREYKFLFDPARLPEKPEAAMGMIWERVKAAAAKHGFKVSEKAEGAFKLEQSYKEYFDTPAQDLWKKGYIIRITQKYKKGIPEHTVSVTVKAVNPDARVAMAVPLAVPATANVEKLKTEAEENVGPAPGGTLNGYVEKGTSFTVALDDLGKLTLGDFSKYMPELAKLGLPADTVLKGNRAYSTRMRPGSVDLPGTEPCGVSMEGWSVKPGEKPYLYDFSFGYGDLDFYDAAQIHQGGEDFSVKAILGELKDITMKDQEKWGGSKVRKLMNRPITH